MKSNNQSSDVKITSSYIVNTNDYDASYTKNILVIGGGRWSKIVVKLLLKDEFGIKQIHIVSVRNYSNTIKWVNEILDNSNNHPNSIVVSKNVDEVLENTDISYVYIANLPKDHLVTAFKAIKKGKHVLVEKPLEYNDNQLEELIELANSNESRLLINHEYRLASYFYNLKNIISKSNSNCNLIHIDWFDSYIENKWGVVKTPDFTVSVVSDLLPHILSILTTILGKTVLKELKLSQQEGGNFVAMSFNYNGVHIVTRLSRNASKTNRNIKVKLISGDIITLNFTHEPGIITKNKVQLEGDKVWCNSLKPLEHSLFLFLNQNHPDSKILYLSKNLHILKYVEKANELLKVEQIKIIRQNLLNTYPLSSISLDVIVALRTLLLDRFLNENVIDNPKNEQDINELLKLTFNIMHKLSTHPFCTQQEISKEFDVSKKVLIKLNKVLKKSDWIQHVITKKSITSKYWNNTIFPLVQSGYLNSVLSKTYEYPYRIGIYPGVSCMFFCSFCGRNNSAKYPKESIGLGSDYFKYLFENAPKSDPYRFYISGGVEPLTNPNIGDIIATGASNGFKLSIYTNGFMLTPQFFEKQSGLWKSDTIRISIYGVDAETTYEVTKKKNAYEKVLKNAKSFLKSRNERNSELKIGFNFVILKDKVDEVLQLAEMIAEINSEAGGERQIDFLTLREDYSVRETNGISNEERIKLITIFRKFDARLKHDDLCGLHVDYGYSLEALRLGNPNYAMEMVTHQDIRVGGYPQISVVTDLYKDIYLYREAGFIERHGAQRYILGRVENNSDFETVLQDFINTQNQISIDESDTDYFDIFDHVVTKLLNKIESDIEFGISPDKGPISNLIYKEQSDNKTIPSHKLLTHFAIETND